MKTYFGKRNPEGIGGAPVYCKQPNAETYPIRERQDLRNHSPDGLNWGYGGSGAAQCALAILADCLGDSQMALRHYQNFKWDFVSKWKHSFEIAEDEILEWLDKQ